MNAKERLKANVVKKAIRSTQLKALAHRAVEQFKISVSKACLIFQVIHTRYRYRTQLDEQNKIIAEWLLKLTNENKTWEFQLYFLYLRNVKGYLWDHKCVYRIYKDLELNLRIKPNKSIKRIKPESFTEPSVSNESYYAWPTQ